jgi:hypothetical protein
MPRWDVEWKSGGYTFQVSVDNIEDAFTWMLHLRNQPGISSWHIDALYLNNTTTELDTCQTGCATKPLMEE